MSTHIVRSGSTTLEIDLGEAMVQHLVPGFHQFLLNVAEMYVSASAPDQREYVATCFLIGMMQFLTQNVDIYARTETLDTIWRLDQLTPEAARTWFGDD